MDGFLILRTSILAGQERLLRMPPQPHKDVPTKTEPRGHQKRLHHLAGGRREYGAHPSIRRSISQPLASNVSVTFIMRALSPTTGACARCS